MGTEKARRKKAKCVVLVESAALLQIRALFYGVTCTNGSAFLQHRRKNVPAPTQGHILSYLTESCAKRQPKC